MRLQARIQEVESTNEVLTQVDEHAAIRQQQCEGEANDKVSFDKARVEEKLRAEEAKSEDNERIIEYEKLLSKRQDTIFTRDRELRELKQRAEEAEVRTVSQGSAGDGHKGAQRGDPHTQV